MQLTMTFMEEYKMNEAIKEGRLCEFVDPEAEPPNFASNELKLIDNLTSILVSNYGEENAFVSDNIWSSYTFHIEIAASVLNEPFILLLLKFLHSHAKRHCIHMAVYDGPDLRKSGGEYLGRIIFNVQEIAGELTLKPLWDKQVGQIDFP